MQSEDQQRQQIIEDLKQHASEQVSLEQFIAYYEDFSLQITNDQHFVERLEN